MAENVHLETQNWLESLIYIALESEANAKHPKWNFNGTFNGENSASPKEQWTTINNLHLLEIQMRAKKKPGKNQIARILARNVTLILKIQFPLFH